MVGYGINKEGFRSEYFELFIFSYLISPTVVSFELSILNRSIFRNKYYDFFYLSKLLFRTILFFEVNISNYSILSDWLLPSVLYFEPNISNTSETFPGNRAYYMWQSFPTYRRNRWWNKIRSQVFHVGNILGTSSRSFVQQGIFSSKCH